MEPQILLAKLRALLERMPDFDQFKPTSHEHMQWLGQVVALVNMVDGYEAAEIKVSSKALSRPFSKDDALGNILAVIHRVIAALELRVPQDSSSAVFAAGEPYDFFRELNQLIGSAESSLFIIDPYLQHSFFDQYLVSRKECVLVRLLLNKGAGEILTAVEKYADQHGNVIEARQSKAIHDRVIFVDGYACWAIGSSLAHAAQAKPTYITALSPDVVSAKLEEYERIWEEAAPL